MIVELFGPPGVGKTTFARALANKLRERGAAAEVVLSYRPAECMAAANPAAMSWGQRRILVLRRLARPVIETLGLALHPFINAHDVAWAIKMVARLRPKRPLRVVREVQYLARLSHSWRRASNVDHVVVFDQAYVQAVCSLALLSGAGDEALLASALEFCPKANLLILLQAPLDVLQRRLDERKRLQSPIERLFELDVGANLGSIATIERVDSLLRGQDRPVTCVASIDERSLGQAVEQTVRQIVKSIEEEHADLRDKDYATRSA